MNRFLIALGVLCILVGVAWPWLGRLGRLPGDIVIEREYGGFYFPIVTSVIVSVVLSLLMWLFRR
jgi:hypothetical protein